MAAYFPVPVTLSTQSAAAVKEAAVVVAWELGPVLAITM